MHRKEHSGPETETENSGCTWPETETENSGCPWPETETKTENAL